MKILFIDTETGGLDPKSNPLLTIGAVLWENGRSEIIGHTLVPLIPGSVCDERAMEINGINLYEHIKVAPDRDEVLKWIGTMLDMAKDEKTGLTTIGGHNVQFDLDFIWAFDDTNKNKPRVKRGYQDTKTIADFLMVAGIIPEQSSALEPLCRYFGIDWGGHMADGDALSSAQLFTRFINLVHRNET